MSWGSFRRALGAVFRATPGGKSSVVQDYRKIVSLGLVDSDGARREEQKLSNQKAATEQASANAAEQARLKALADESVRQQEEAARRRTIFGGESIDQVNQRKTLLGL